MVYLVVVVLRSPIHANEPSEYNGMLYRTSNRVLNNGIKVIILICMDGTSQYHHHRLWYPIITKSYNNKCNISHMREQMLDKDPAKREAWSAESSALIYTTGILKLYTYHLNI